MQYCIIGGGLAGTLLASRLLMKQKKVVLIDDEADTSASRVAAGMFNIITGKNFIKSWMADELLQSLSAFFEIEIFRPLQKHLHQTPIYRPFYTIEEYNNAVIQSQKPEYQPYISLQFSPVHEDMLHNPLGGMWINGCGWLNIADFLKELQTILTQHFDFTYLTGKFAAANISLTQKQLIINDQTLAFDHLIFCQGANCAANQIWDIPVIPNKGETLILHAPALTIEFPISGKHYLLPFGNQQFVVGSTYQWKFEHTNPTEEAKAELSQYLTELLKVPFEMLTQKAGIRPTTSDRRPILGTHPEHSFLHTFTGFGTKGVLLSFHFSEVMTRYLLGEQPLEKEYNLTRFKKKSL